MSTLKVNTIEKYSGSSGVTIKDSVSIAPDSGVKNLVVSGTITAETSLVASGTMTCQGNATFNGNILGDGSTDISNIDSITTGGNLIVGGGLTVTGVLQFNPFKCMGTVDHNCFTDTITARSAEFNVETVTSYSNGGKSMCKIEFGTALTNTNYQVFFRSPLNAPITLNATFCSRLTGLTDLSPAATSLITWWCPHEHLEGQRD